MSDPNLIRVFFVWLGLVWLESNTFNHWRGLDTDLYTHEQPVLVILKVYSIVTNPQACKHCIVHQSSILGLFLQLIQIQKPDHPPHTHQPKCFTQCSGLLIHHLETFTIKT